MKKYLVALLLAGCTLTPKALPPVSTYDLGPMPQPQPQVSLPLHPIIQLAEISAPVWLDTQAIRYRLAYHDPAQTYAYANSRWAAPPAKLLTERIRQHIATYHGETDSNISDGLPAASYLLRIELSEFVQIFEQAHSSQVMIGWRAHLFERKTQSIVAQRNFSLAGSTETADAAGAVKAFIWLSDQLASELTEWLVRSISQAQHSNRSDISNRRSDTVL
ncbi:ABC-type transport auxiliary lipoprotein family protein [Nitrosomonas halophila]|uniref:Cholesterol transport system auxiliary component n=1 Tax=Nitrosomonas halophila TaxID=44576 RepID=A0A1H3HDW8_9PROT|nr:ABC-type transport auxiliary lipoprotein family protein [Nitrosomonas halophila]SDY13667.1 cholesterol transport system auxiliary component [Nitrosomonas halophila]